MYIDYDPQTLSTTRLFAIAFHEISHLIAAWQVGPLPPWYGEGLAEYFETMTVAGQGANFRPAAMWREDAATAPIMSLDAHTSLTRRDWWDGDLARRYQTAGTLFAFLYSHDTGRTTLQRMALDASDNRCSDSPSKGLVGLATYPGGITALDRQLGQWGARP